MWLVPWTVLGHFSFLFEIWPFLSLFCTFFPPTAIHFFSFIVWFLQVALFYVSVLISMFDIGDFFQMLSDPRLPLHSSVLRTEKETGSPMGAACAGWLLWPYCDLVQSLGDTWISYSSVGNRPGSQHSGISEGKIYRALNSQHRTFT